MSKLTVFKRSNFGQYIVIYFSMKPETSDFTDTDEETNEGEQKNYINHAKRSITSIDKKVIF